MTDEAWSAMLAAQWRSMMQVVEDRRRRERRAARLARLRRALAYIQALKNTA